MIRLNQKTDCAGCGGCRQVCPRRCISYRPDDEGFFYPVVDLGECIQCGLCEQVCPMPRAASGNAARSVSACKSRDAGARAAGGSGGVFPLLAEAVLQKGGAVFGAAMENGSVLHRKAETKEELAGLCGSKYVQSDTWECFRETRELLSAGRTVLFSGVPCQIYGLSCFLQKPYENLLMVDTVCMGVPSPGVWAEYLAARETEGGGPLIESNFRDKAAPDGLTGWRDYALSLSFEGGGVYRASHQSDPYLSGFGRALFLRPSCHACRFKGDNRQSDLTLGDYWGIETLFPDMDDGGGVSLVIARTEKGEAWLDSIAHQLELRPAELRHAEQTHPSLVCSIPPSPRRKRFFREFSEGKAILPLLRRRSAPAWGERLRRSGGRLLRRLGKV